MAGGLNMKKHEKMRMVIELLHKDGRTPITHIAKELNIPKSTVFDYMQEIKHDWSFTIVKK